MLVSLCSKNVQKLENNEYFLQNGKSIGIVQKEQKQEVDVMWCCIRCVWYCTISLHLAALHWYRNLQILLYKAKTVNIQLHHTFSSV